ncbi:unnamed protein product [Brugia timori]|uniref:Pept_C1 domain-containing protein n=1 Tax=Brugia timori TaxID=42155 RepID=A0A0R3QDA0_9BILA|nr:unnamed protein product [Brugia timori]
MGFKYESLYTNTSYAEHHKWIKHNCQPNYRKNVSPDPTKSCGPYKPTNDKDKLAYSDVAITDLPEKFSHKNAYHRNHDTIGMIVVDFENNISSGTSTNGANHKIPGFKSCIYSDYNFIIVQSEIEDEYVSQSFKQF